MPVPFPALGAPPLADRGAQSSVSSMGGTPPQCSNALSDSNWRRATDVGQPASRANIPEQGELPAETKWVDPLENRNLIEGAAHKLFALENGPHRDEQIMGAVRFHNVAVTACIERGFRNVGMSVFA